MKRLVFLIAILVTFGPVAAQTSPERELVPTQQMRALAASFGVLRASFVKPLDGADVVNAAIRGMLREIDPQSGEYWTEDEYQEFRRGPPPGTGSIGTELRWRDGVWLLSPVENGPAFKAGIRFADQLRAIDGLEIDAFSSTQIVRRIQGPVGSEVVLTVYRGEKLKTIHVQRALVPQQMPSLSVLEGNLRVLQLRSISPNQLQTAFRLLKESWMKERFAGLVLDMRGNQGGLVQSSVALASAFLPRDSVVVSFNGRDPSNSRVFRASPKDYSDEVAEDPLVFLPEDLRKVPLILLADGQTASGAEIVVAALKDHRRALVVGRPTFGRGSIQTVTPIPGSGAIKYTSAYWVSPGGKSFNQAPIQPDRLVLEQEIDADFSAAVSMMRAAIDLSPTKRDSAK